MSRLSTLAYLDTAYCCTQVLTHIKEKLQFVQQENRVLDGDLGVLEMSVSGLRDRLTRAKKTRDALRKENAELKQKQGFIGSDLLVSDFEGRKGLSR